MNAEQPLDYSALAAAGFDVHHGGDEDAELRGRWWWTLSRDGWSGIETSAETFDSCDAAWADAQRELDSDEELRPAARAVQTS